MVGLMCGATILPYVRSKGQAYINIQRQRAVPVVMPVGSLPLIYGGLELLLFMFDYRALSCFGWLTRLGAGPSFGIPKDTVEVDFATGLRVCCIKAVIEHPVLPGIVCHEVGVMTRTDYVLAAFQHQGEIVVHGRFPLFVNIRTEEVFRACHNHAVGTSFSFAT